MNSFVSKYSATLDGKGRIVLPAPFKRELGDAPDPVLVIEKSTYEACLNIYPYAVWKTTVDEWSSRLNPNNPQHSKFLSRYFEEIVTLTMAENGRLNIPDSMLTHVGIVKEAIFTGQGKLMKLWEPSRHEASRLSDEDYANLFQELLGGPMNNFK